MLLESLWQEYFKVSISMRVLVQRVKSAGVTINSTTERNIAEGLLVFVGIEITDNEDDARWLATKISNLRIFDDKDGIMNLSIKDIDGELMLISQFTLFAKTKKGNRPSYIKSAPPNYSKPLYEEFIKLLSKEISKEVVSGEFGADMQVELINNGPVTIWIDTKNKE